MTETAASAVVTVTAEEQLPGQVKVIDLGPPPEGGQHVPFHTPIELPERPAGLDLSKYKFPETTPLTPRPEPEPPKEG